LSFRDRIYGYGMDFNACFPQAHHESIGEWRNILRTMNNNRDALICCSRVHHTPRGFYACVGKSILNPITQPDHNGIEGHVNCDSLASIRPEKICQIVGLGLIKNGRYLSLLSHILLLLCQGMGKIRSFFVLGCELGFCRLLMPFVFGEFDFERSVGKTGIFGFPVCDTSARQGIGSQFVCRCRIELGLDNLDVG